MANIRRSSLTTSNAFIVVSSRLAAKHPSSGEPPSHIPNVIPRDEQEQKNRFQKGAQNMDRILCRSERVH